MPRARGIRNSAIDKSSMNAKNKDDEWGSSSGVTLPRPNLNESQLNQLEMTPITDETANETARLQDLENLSSSENPAAASGHDDRNRRSKKKVYVRHTPEQIQELEAYFKNCPHPDEKQRKELGRQLGLDPVQIKFWFQNKRTHMKTHMERYENMQLRAERERLLAENMSFKEALLHALCHNCGGSTSVGKMSKDVRQLILENARLKDEVERISGIANKHAGKPAVNQRSPSPPVSRPVDFGIGNSRRGQSCVGESSEASGEFLALNSAPAKVDKLMIIERAEGAMEELISMAQMSEPLWITSFDSTCMMLNENEYIKRFSRGIGPKPRGFISEASRESALVFMNHVKLIEILMDAKRWCTVFSGIVFRAATLKVLSTREAGNYNGTLQVMTTELQTPTPLVATREDYFVRYCKHHSEGAWAVVDVSLDNVQPGSVVKFRRRPSGCLIQELPNGRSKVTWVEHVEVDDGGVQSPYRHLVNTGLTFGAKRWVAILDRHCERLASVATTSIPFGNIGEITNQEGRKSILKLAERLVSSFCSGVSASTGHTWQKLSGTGADDVRMTTSKSVDDPGRPLGIVLSAAQSLWVPVPHKIVFDFLRNENSRSEWDVLSQGAAVQERAHIAYGGDTGNCMSILRLKSRNSSQRNMLIVQESFTDTTGSFIVYAPVDTPSMNVIFNGGDSDYIPILPAGFSILPHGSTGRGRSAGSLLTIAYQILVDTDPTAKLSPGSLATVNNMMARTIEKIKASLSGQMA